MNLQDKLNRSLDPEPDSGPAKKTLESLLAKKKTSSSGGSAKEMLTKYGGTPGESIDQIRTAYAANPGNIGLANVLAGMLYTTSQYQEAAQLYQQIVDKDSSDGNAWMQLANCQTGLQHWGEAFRSYAWALQYLSNPLEKEKCQDRMAAVEKMI